MQILISLTDDEQTALNKFGRELGADLTDAAKTALRHWLIERGYLGAAGAQLNRGGPAAGE